MSDSFGVGYTTRSDEEGFEGIYGGNQALLKSIVDKACNLEIKVWMALSSKYILLAPWLPLISQTITTGMTFFMRSIRFPFLQGGHHHVTLIPFLVYKFLALVLSTQFTTAAINRPSDI
uniref:Uncharacterized protein n=1 Tax=Nelumbo nucifera TaxID=4432 RepID=A0A822YVQ0_NELNU|nr:TPA_asm: hypothetical protein HUJ06_007403 [Nelumbo nucifera]